MDDSNLVNRDELIRKLSGQKTPTEEEQRVVAKFIAENPPELLAKYLRSEHSMRGSVLELAWYYIDEILGDQPYDRLYHEEDNVSETFDEDRAVQLLQELYAQKYGQSPNS